MTYSRDELFSNPLNPTAFRSVRETQPQGAKPPVAWRCRTVNRAGWAYLTEHDQGMTMDDWNPLALHSDYLAERARAEKAETEVVWWKARYREARAELATLNPEREEIGRLRDLISNVTARAEAAEKAAEKAEAERDDAYVASAALLVVSASVKNVDAELWKSACEMCSQELAALRAAAQAVVDGADHGGVFKAAEALRDALASTPPLKPAEHPDLPGLQRALEIIDGSLSLMDAENRIQAVIDGKPED